VTVDAGAAHTNGNGSGVDTEAVRAWAKTQGLPVSDRGRIAKDVRQQYNDANPTTVEPAEATS
jgi:hypothetical protein